MNKQFRLTALCVASLIVLPACLGDKKEVKETTSEVTVTETTPEAKEVVEMPVEVVEVTEVSAEAPATDDAK